MKSLRRLLSKNNSIVITNTVSVRAISTPETVISYGNSIVDVDDNDRQQRRQDGGDGNGDGEGDGEDEDERERAGEADQSDWALCELAKKWCKEGDQAYREGNYDMALMKYKQMLHVPQSIPSSVIAGQHISQLAMGSMGRVYAKQQNFNDAFLLYDRSLDLARELNNRRGEALILLKLAVLNKDLRRYKKALKQSDEAVSIFREIDCKRDEALALENVGDILQKLRKDDLSKMKYKESRRILRSIGSDQNGRSRSREGRRDMV